MPELIAGLSVSDSIRFNIVWADQFSERVAAGDLYPRWLPDSWAGRGSPAFYFYPPLAFWVIAVLQLASFGLAPSEVLIPVASALALAASGLLMRAWLVRAGAGRQAALAGALAYMLAPYHLFDIYARGAIAEAWSYVLVPCVLLAIDGVAQRGGRGLPWLALAYAGLILAHLPSALLASLFLIPPAIAFQAWQMDTQRTAFLVRAFAAGVLGLVLAAAYLLPALTLLPHVSGAALTGQGFRPEDWFFWRAETWAAPRMMLIGAETGGLALLGVSIVAGLRMAPLARCWAALTIVLALLIAGVPGFIWTFPPIAMVQFPWRLLPMAELAAITSLALAVGSIRRTPLVPALSALSTAAALLVVIIAGRVENAVATSAESLRRIRAEYREAPEYLPAGVPIAWGRDGADPTRIRLPDVALVEVRPLGQRGASDRDVRVLAVEYADGGMDVMVEAPWPTVVAVRRFSFPHWELKTIAGRVQPLWKTGDRRVAWIAPKGQSVFQLRLGSVAVERLGSSISLSGLVVLIGLLSRDWFSRRDVWTRKSPGSRDAPQTLSPKEEG